MPTLLLSPAELESLTGYTQAARQLAELHRQGFWRARRLPVTGRVALEREHYAAICAADSKATQPAKRQPQLRAA